MPGSGGRGSFQASGFMEWVLPYGAPSAAPWIAMMAQRHFHEFGTTREQLGQIAVNARTNAALNPKAIYTDPMTIDDYLDGPGDLETAAAVRLRRSLRRRHRDDRVARRHDPRSAQAAGPGGGRRHRAARPSVVGPVRRPHDDGVRDASAQLWTRTDLTPSDVQVAEMYDGFSFITMAWLEAMGFCGKGEAGPVRRGRAQHRP